MPNASSICESRRLACISLCAVALSSRARIDSPMRAISASPTPIKSSKLLIALTVFSLDLASCKSASISRCSWRMVWSLAWSLMRALSRESYSRFWRTHCSWYCSCKVRAVFSSAWAARAKSGLPCIRKVSMLRSNWSAFFLYSRYLRSMLLTSPPMVAAASSSSRRFCSASRVYCLSTAMELLCKARSSMSCMLAEIRVWAFSKIEAMLNFSL